MAALSPNLPIPLSASRRLEGVGHEGVECAVCGCSDVEVDFVEDLGTGVAPALELGECPRCEHRWTRPVEPTRRREAQSFARPRSRNVRIPNAA